MYVLLYCPHYPTVYTSMSLTSSPIDIDECNENRNNCDDNANCTNTNGSFTCTCIEGWSGDGVTCTSEFIIIINRQSLHAADL